MTALRRIAAALTYRDFRVLWLGAFTSTIGTWMQKVAQSWLVLTITGSSSAFFCSNVTNSRPRIASIVIKCG